MYLLLLILFTIKSYISYYNYQIKEYNKLKEEAGKKAAAIQSKLDKVKLFDWVLFSFCFLFSFFFFFET